MLHAEQLLSMLKMQLYINALQHVASSHHTSSKAGSRGCKYGCTQAVAAQSDNSVLDAVIHHPAHPA